MKTSDRLALRRVVHLAMLLSLLPFGRLMAQTSFSDLDLQEDGRLLVRSTSAGFGRSTQGSLFLMNLQDRRIDQLSVYPENLEVLEDATVLQIRNSYGLVRISLRGGLPAGVKGFSSFISGAVVSHGRTPEMVSSPDGRWMLFLEPTSAAYGDLVLINARTGERIPIAGRLERDAAFFPATWSPDSSTFIYCREQTLYFRSVAPSVKTQVDERFRAIAAGHIRAVSWGSENDFYLLSASTLYRIRLAELSTKTLYASFLELGSIVGHLPIAFDSGFDRYWVDARGTSMLFLKGNRNLFYIPLDGTQAATEASLESYLLLPALTTGVEVLWPEGQAPSVCVRSGTDAALTMYRIAPRSDSRGATFAQFPVPGTQVRLSPDGSKVLVFGDQGATVLRYADWKVQKSILGIPCLNALWIRNEELICADAGKIERVQLAGQRTLLCLSGIERSGWSLDGTKIKALSGGVWYETDGASPWQISKEAGTREPIGVSRAYRVYLERLSASTYENMPYVRSLSALRTEPLFTLPRVDSPAVALGDAPDTDAYGPEFFKRGKRSGQRELALCFDLYGDSAGLPETLLALESRKIRATFFINGEFIRRHPAITRELALRGHEIASLFYAPIDLADARFSIDASFIQRGLARNEDDYFALTGRELALLWHPPWYSVSSEIVRAARDAGYITVGRDLDPLDWFSLRDARNQPSVYRSASALVDEIATRIQPGSIVPIRLGTNPGGRDDYLFQRLDILLDALLEARYSIVPVSTLMEHSR